MPTVDEKPERGSRSKQANSVRSNLQKIEPNTPEMEMFLGVGYDGMTVDEAKAIIAEREKNPASHPYEELKKAKAFLAAYSAKPVAVDTEPGWQRSRRAE